MYSLITFLIICTVQYLFFIWKRSDIRDYQEMGSTIADATTLSRREIYGKTVIFLSNISNIMKRYLWPILIFILFINSMLAIIIGTVTHFILNLL